MLGEKFILKNKKNNRLRNILLLITICLFIIFIIIFISSFREYKRIQHRIHSIYDSAYSENLHFINIYTNYNDAEYYFRLFILEFDPKHYKSYELKLREINFEVDSLINENLKSDHDFNFASDIENRKILSKELSILKLKLATLIDSSISKTSPPTLNPSKKLSPNKEHTTTIYPVKPTSITPSYVIVDERPLMKSLFSKKKDTIKFDGGEYFNSEKESHLKNHQSEINTIEFSTQRHIQAIKSSFNEVRHKERQLLSLNFELLNEICNIIQSFQKLETENKINSTKNEVKSLLNKSSTFKWQIIFCLFFMFAMICIIVYYQFFTNYYERKLLDERIYASKLTKEKTDILAEITHEIRTPINSLIGILDLLRKKDHLYDKKEVMLLDSIYSNINNTSKTINDILNLSKIEDDNSSNFTNFNINDVTQEVIELNQNQAILKNITIKSSKIENNACLIYSDEFKIRQILTNLISNAIKYSDKGIVDINIKIDDQNNLVIEVEDQGIGIPEAVQHHIYRKYYTVNRALKLDSGVGLGLFITKKITNSLKGKISFISKKHEGTTFKVEIPLPKTVKETFQASKITSIEDFPKGLSWLIVDDNALNLLYMKQFFERCPQLHSATNGHQAFNIIQSNKVDIVITDINMPIMTGDQLLVQIRSKKEYDHIKVIATSSDNEQVKELEKLHHLNFDGILIKPFNEKKLIETIDYTLRNFKST